MQASQRFESTRIDLMILKGQYQDVSSSGVPCYIQVDYETESQLGKGAKTTIK